MFGGDGGNAYFCGEKNKEVMTRTEIIINAALSLITLLIVVITPFLSKTKFWGWVEKHADEYEREKKEKEEEKKKKKAIMKANARKTKKEEDLRYLGACFMD